MPDINASTPRETYTIAGQTFSFYQPYAEGHVLTANEAASMNQTFAENVRNNFAKRVKEAVEAGTFDQDMVQSQLDDYMNEYEFGQRTGGGGRTSDPVAAEALRIAKDRVRAALQKRGDKLSDYTAAAITDAAKGVLAGPKGDEIRAAAATIVATANALGGDDDLNGVEVAKSEPAADAAPTRSRKQAAE